MLHFDPLSFKVAQHPTIRGIQPVCYANLLRAFILEVFNALLYRGKAVAFAPEVVKYTRPTDFSQSLLYHGTVCETDQLALHRTEREEARLFQCA